jgi:hypothetical protein
MRLVPLKIKSFLPIPLYFPLMALVLILLSSMLLTNGVYGQIFPNTQASGTASSSSTFQQQGKPNLHLVKITSPSKGQQVPTDKDLEIYGTSEYNITSDCKVSVIVNGIKPYQLTFPHGDAGVNDYSRWSFTLTPEYTSIKEGQNKITAKFSCTNDPNLISHNSVNVTGIGTSLVPTANQQEQQYAGKNSTTTNVNTTSTGNTIPSVISSFTPGGGTMSLSVHLTKKSVHPGDKQSIIIKVTDMNSTTPVVGASVLGRVTDSSGGLFKKLQGTTDDTGKSSYSWKVSQDDTTGKYKAIIEVSAYGYQNNTASKSFKVSSIPVTSATNSNNNLIPLPSPFINNNNDNHQNRPSTIIPIPHVHIPTIKIPFHLPFH